MLSALLSLAIYLVIAGLIYWAVTTIVNAIPMPAIIKTVVNVIMVVVICLIVLFALLDLLGMLGAPVRLRRLSF